jgi:hypothetical protein
VCIRMEGRCPGRPQTGPSWWCILCARPYCKTQSGKEQNVCEINHITYYKNHYGREYTYRNLEEREKALEKENKRLEQREQHKQKENMDIEGESVADEEKFRAAEGEDKM